MKFGIFGGARQKRGLADTDSSTGYRDWIENNIAVEAPGNHSTFTTEYHSTGLGQVSVSIDLLTYCSISIPPLDIALQRAKKFSPGAVSD